jgi:iron complex outermembrane recepter protein
MTRRTARTAALAAALAAPASAAQDTLAVLPLDTVTVDVLRTPVAAIRAPFPVSVVTESEIRPGRPGLSVADALRAVPGVQVESRYNLSLGDRISIRGFGARAGFGVRGVRVLVDGIPATLPDGQTTLTHVDPASLGRAEVIRGPAAALYGNASGGVIRLSSPPPPAGPAGSEHRLLAGAHGLRRAESAAGGTAGRLAYRANLSWLDFAGYRQHQETTRRTGGATVRWEGGRDRLGLVLAAAGWEAQNPGSLTDSLLRLDRRAAFANNVRQRTRETGSQEQAGLSWRRELGPVGLEVTGHVLARTLENPIPAVVIDLERRVAGGRAALSGGGAALRWSAGAEAERQRDRRRNHANVEGERGALTLRQDERVSAASLHAQATATPDRRLDVTGALRFDRFRFSVADRLITETNPDDSGSRTMESWSPALGVSLALHPRARVYANLATAFETPTTTELANRPDGAGGFNPGLQPQRTRSLEAGVKARLLPGTWVEAAAYRAAIRDALIPFEVPEAPGRTFYRNAGEARHRGVELAASLARGDDWTVRGAYTHTDARFDRYVVRGVDLAGNRVPGVAPHRLELSLLRAPRRGAWLGADLRHASSTPVADADAEGRFASPAATVVDLRAGWEAAGGRGRFSPFAGAVNLFDARHNAAVAVNAFGGRYYEPAPGRSLYAGVGVALGSLAR